MVYQPLLSLEKLDLRGDGMMNSQAVPDPVPESVDGRSETSLGVLHTKPSIVTFVMLFAFWKYGTDFPKPGISM